MKARISANADLGPEYGRFQRLQSLDMRAREWEERLPPFKGYLASLANAIGIAAAVGCLFVAMMVFQ